MDSGSPLNPNRTTVDNVMKMLEGIHKALRPEGIFVSITFGQVIVILIFLIPLPCSFFVKKCYVAVFLS